MNASLGVYAHRIEDQPWRPFGAQTSLIRDLITVAAPSISVFAFGPNDVNTQTAQVTGWVSNPDHSWTGHTLNLPDVIWDRLLDQECLGSDAQTTREYLLATDLAWINHPSAQAKLQDKLFVHDLLRVENVPTPATSIFDWDSEQLQSFLTAFTTVYVKPRYGAKGSGVVRLALTGGKEQKVKISGLGDKWVNFGIVLDELGGMFHYSRDLIIQQGIEPPILKNRTRPVAFDVRALLQKPEYNWQVVGMMTRVGNADSVTSNLAMGGSPHPLDFVTENLQGPVNSNGMVDRLAAISVNTANALNRGIGGLREVGIDILLNSEGEPTVLECNSKPGRKGFRELSLSHEVLAHEARLFGEVRMRSLDNIILAAHHLCHISLA